MADYLGTYAGGFMHNIAEDPESVLGNEDAGRVQMSVESIKSVSMDGKV